MTTCTAKSVISRSNSAELLVSTWKNEPTWRLGIQHHPNISTADKNSGSHTHQRGKYKNALPKSVAENREGFGFLVAGFLKINCVIYCCLLGKCLSVIWRVVDRLSN